MKASHLIAGSLFVASALASGPARAHPHHAAAASVDRYLDFVYVGDGRFRVAYVLDFAEGPAYAEVEALDADHDGAVTVTEQQRYLATRLPALMDRWEVVVGGVRVRPRIVTSRVDVAPGEGGLETVHIDCELAVAGPRPASGKSLELFVRDDTFPDVPGVRVLHADESDDAGAGSSAWNLPDAGAYPRVSSARFFIAPRPSARPSASARPYLPALAAVIVALVVGLVSRRGPRGSTRPRAPSPRGP